MNSGKLKNTFLFSQIEKWYKFD